MQPLPRLTSERLASLPAGTRLKMGGHIVKLVGRGVFTNDAGITQNMVDYVDSRGVPGSFEEKFSSPRQPNTSTQSCASTATHFAIRMIASSATSRTT